MFFIFMTFYHYHHFHHFQHFPSSALFSAFSSFCYYFHLFWSFLRCFVFFIFVCSSLFMLVHVLSPFVICIYHFHDFSSLSSCSFFFARPCETWRCADVVHMETIPCDDIRCQRVRKGEIYVLPLATRWALERLQEAANARGGQKRRRISGGGRRCLAVDIGMELFRSTQECPEAPQTPRGLSIPSKIVRTLNARASGHAALRTGAGSWEIDALAWGLFTCEYFDLLILNLISFDPCFRFLFDPYLIFLIPHLIWRVMRTWQ